MKPKGNLLIIGGAEDKVGQPPDIKEQMKEFHRYEILSELLPNSKHKKIEIITTASEVQEEVIKTYEKVFQAIGYNHVGFIPIKERNQAQEKEYIGRVEKAGAVFFTGGDQFRLSTILGGTPVVEMIKYRYLHDQDFTVAGTSAGAMVMSAVMITEGGLTEALVYRNISLSSGFGFIDGCIIDTHFIKRGRFGRLAHAIIMSPEQLGIGLGEDTALIIKNGSDAECRGSGMVVIIDGRYIHQTNIATAVEGEAIFVENLKVHLLVKGCRFSIKTRKLVDPAMAPK